MADKLLIRAFNVEVGDCIYCRIPKGRKVGGVVDDFHMLVDCGSVGPGSNLVAAVTRLKTELLPDAGGGKKRLDLLVVTHEHKDHIAGFDPQIFDDIKIESIWMNAAMDPTHPQAGQTLQLHRAATTAMRNIAALNLSLSPELGELVALFGVDNDDAMEALRETLPTQNGITPQYVHAGMDGAQLGLPLKDVKITVLGPEKDIDHFYLGADADPNIHALAETGAAFRSGPPKAVAHPANISQSDFRRLQSRMLSSAFAFAELSSKVTNNTSIVLLVEWSGKRLLFVGDAEWDSKFQEGKANGAWNVMWHERKNSLSSSIDFLKIGHHGSENATPWNEGVAGSVNEPSTILDSILPVSGSPAAKAVVSTKRKNYETIPRGQLLAELGKRVENTRNYKVELGSEASSLPKYTQFEKPWLDKPQPWRTDCETMLSGDPFVDVEIDP
jgi:hypothetical protein